MPSIVITSAWPCDSPAVKNLNIRAQFYLKDLRTSGAAARLHEGFRLHAGLHLMRHGWTAARSLLRVRPESSVGSGDRRADVAGVRGDEPLVAAPAPGPLIELLDHGIDGSPRWIVMAANATEWRTHSRTVAVEARRRGYVPMALDIFLRTRLLLAEELRTRTLVLIAKPDAPRRGAAGGVASCCRHFTRAARADDIGEQPRWTGRAPLARRRSARSVWRDTATGCIAGGAVGGGRGPDRTRAAGGRLRPGWAARSGREAPAGGRRRAGSPPGGGGSSANLHRTRSSAARARQRGRRRCGLRRGCRAG